MSKYKKLFTDFMDNNAIKYVDHNDSTVSVGYNTKNLPTINVFAFFADDDLAMVNFRFESPAKFNAEKRAAGLEICNALNVEYRWVSFFINDCGDVIVRMDAYLDEETCGEECLLAIKRIVSITDEAYPEIMKALWS